LPLPSSSDRASPARDELAGWFTKACQPTQNTGALLVLRGAGAVRRKLSFAIIISSSARRSAPGGGGGAHSTCRVFQFHFSTCFRRPRLLVGGQSTGTRPSVAGAWVRERLFCRSRLPRQTNVRLAARKCGHNVS